MKKNSYHDVIGERKDQLLVLVDKNGKYQGTETREECHRGQGKTHLAFVAFLVNKSGEFLLTKRSENKSLWAGYWDAATISHVLPGESVEQAANRRGKEELGVDVTFRKVGSFHYFARYQNSAENEYCYVLIGETQEKVDHNTHEIEEIKYMTLSNIKKDINDHHDKYTPWLKLSLEKFRL